jgi:hypothetical protein
MLLQRRFVDIKILQVMSKVMQVGLKLSKRANNKSAKKNVKNKGSN